MVLHAIRKVALIGALAVVSAVPAGAAEIVIEAAAVRDGGTPRLDVKADARVIGSITFDAAPEGPADPAAAAAVTARVALSDDLDPRRLILTVPAARAGGPGAGTGVLVRRVALDGVSLPAVAARLSAEGAMRSRSGILLSPGGSVVFARPYGGWPKPPPPPPAPVEQAETAQPAPAVPAPGPASPAPPPDVRCPPDSEAIVGYGTKDVEVPAGAMPVIARVARAVVGRPCRVSVVGYASISGTAAVNLDLSRRRAEAVAQALVVAGVPRTRLEIRAEGATDRFGPQRENRRVMIEVAPD
jgi:outer membrane protein OmpA-like peptidoglycan-associated protein